MEVLNRLLSRAREADLFRGLFVREDERRVEMTHVFLTDTLLFCERDDSVLHNIKCVLVCFEAVLGLKIKCVLVCFEI